jgi:hypothetical protein
LWRRSIPKDRIIIASGHFESAFHRNVQTGGKEEALGVTFQMIIGVETG